MSGKSNLERQDAMDLVHPEVRYRVNKILEECKLLGWNVGIFETYRTLDRQKWLKSNGKSETLNSYHRLGLAVDIVFKTANGNWTWGDNYPWKALGEVMEKHGMYSLFYQKGWDGPHCQLMIPGVKVTSLYKYLNECNGNVREFWIKHIDEYVENKFLAKTESKGEDPSIPKEAPPIPVVTIPVEKAEVPEKILDTVPTKTYNEPTNNQGWFSTLLNLIFGRSK